MKTAFWIGVACVAWAYFAYPLAIAIAAKLRSRYASSRSDTVSQQQKWRVSLVLVVRDEAALLRRRLDELTSLLSALPGESELIVVSDGSTDDTVRIAHTHPHPAVRVVELPESVGKALALTRGCEAARGEILVLADVRQRWAPDTIARLLENFSDPHVGAVSGELVIESAPGVVEGVGLYWRYEKWLRRNQGLVHSTVGVSGSVSAVRRSLFRPIPPGTILDDVYWPLQVAMQGYRVIHDDTALAFDRFPPRARGEFQRKIRTLSGNLQLLTIAPEAFVPWRNPIWIQLVSHKMLRLIVPWALLVILITSAALDGLFYRVALIGQAAFYGVALLGLSVPAVSRSRVASAAGAFLVLNAAAWCAFWIWISGNAGKSWKKVKYSAPLLPEDRGS